MVLRTALTLTFIVSVNIDVINLSEELNKINRYYHTFKFFHMTNKSSIKFKNIELTEKL